MTMSYHFYEETDELYHYGRKGMKWGQNIFGKVKSGAKTAGKKTAELAKKGYSKAKTSHEIRKASANAAKLRKKPLKDLTDDELNARLKRLELEKRVSDLQKQTAHVTAGQAFLSKVGKDVLVPATMNAAKEVMERWLKKHGYDIAGLKDTQYGRPEGFKEAEEAKLRKEKADNIKKAVTTEDWLKDRKEKEDRKAAEKRADEDVEETIRKAEQKAERKAKKAAKAAEKYAKKVYTGTVSGDGTSRRQTSEKKPKPDDYYDPIETSFVDKNEPVSNVKQTSAYQTGLSYIERLLLNP